jgi:nucleoside phosphorylase
MVADNQNQGRTVLFAGAFAPEIDLLRNVRSATGPAAGGPARYEVLETGIGSVAAATALQARLLGVGLMGVAGVIFVGSAGVYQRSLAYGPGHFGCSTQFCKRDLAVLEGRGRIPADLSDTIETASGPQAGLIADSFEAGALLRGIANSTDSVTLAEVNSGAEPHFENMEAFGLAWVCRRYGLPFTAFFALTNYVGPAGSDEWRANYRTMSIDLQQRVLAAIGAGIG